ncbi:MAG: hypothetical protein H3C35_12170, partial [Bacteroidetes bacterium]|nr:hypothetical protein [Bacteroidota bacterium]
MKFHFFFLLVLPVFVFSSGKIQRFSWGEALFKENSVMTLRFVHERDEHISIAETPKQYFYYALAPTEQISISASGYISEKISSSAKIGTYRLQSDSSYSFIESERSEREKFNSLLPSEPSVRITGYEWYRGYYLAKIEIIPLVQSEKNLQTERLTELTVQIKKRMISRAMKSTPEKPLKKNDPQFETILKNLILNYDDAVPYQLEQTTADSTSWFNPALIYLKLHIGRDGIYRLTYAQLQNSFPEILSADPRTIKLFLNGTEVPIYVAGETDGIFDAADYLEFSAERNYTGKQRIITTGNTEYNEYLNRYSDSTVYWLTFSSGNGERLPVNPSAVPTTDALKNYTDFRHLEQNSFIQFAGGDVVLQQSPFYTSQDLWGWGWLNGNSENKQSFSFSDLAATNDSGIVSAKYASWGGTTSSRTHAIALRVGKGSTSGADLRNDTINRYEQFVSSAKFPLSSIQNGTNNVSLFSYPTSSTPVNSVIVDWYELEIPRQLKAISDSLSFRFSYLITTDVRTIQLSNLSTQAVVIYKFASAPKRISNILFSGTGPYTASFVDTVGPGDRYYLTANSKILTPVIVKKKQFTNLRANTSQTDYIIVTHNKFFNETIPLKNYLASARNFSVRLLDIDDIYDEFGFGYPTPEALQRYLQSSTSWQMPLPAYVLLVGDASYDYKFVYKNYNAINYVPSYGYPVSDPLLVTWSSLSQFPQMITGRLSVNNAGEVTAYLNRLQAYSSLGNSDWNKRYMFFTGGDPNTSGQIESFKATNDVVINSYVTPAPIGGSSTHFYKTKNPQSDFGPFSMQEFKNAVSLGSVFISYIGHSGTQTWDNSILDPAQLRNDYNKSPLITDFGCSTGKFAEPQITSFSELFVVGSSSYAVGYIGNSALGFTSIASTLPIEFYKKILRDTVTQIGKAHLTAKIALAQNSFNSTNQVMLYTNELIGEPSVSLDVPFTPNLAVTSSNISAQGILSDDLDSGIVNIVINNFGSVLQDSVNIYIQHRYNNSVIDNSVVKIPFPLFASTIRYSLQTKNASGTHTLIVTI